MRPLLLLISTLFLFAHISTAQTDHSLFTTDTIPVSEAVNNYGEYRTFCDEITSINIFTDMEGKPTIMQLSDEQPGIALVIWAGDAEKFEEPPREHFSVGDKVCVTGQISRYGNAPRLEVGNPKQLHLVD